MTFPARVRRAAIRERGAATVWVLAAGLLTILVAAVSTASGAAMVARHRAQAAADLGALAGAARILDGPGPACARASEVVARNGARLVACEVEEFDVVVTVQATPFGVVARIGSARATSRAGPHNGAPDPGAKP